MEICNADFYAGFWDLKFIISEFFEKCIFNSGSADFYNYILYFMAGALISTLLFVCVNSCGSNILSRIFYRFFMPNFLMEELRRVQTEKRASTLQYNQIVESTKLRRTRNVSLFLAAAAGGSFFLLAYNIIKGTAFLHFTLVMFTILFVAVLADIRFGIIPDSVHVMAVTVFLVWNGCLYFPWIRRYGLPEVVNIISCNRSFWGLLAGGGFLLFLRIVSRGGMGWGDIKLGCVLGLLQGVEGVFICFFIAFVLSGILSIPYVLLSEKRANPAIPFAPFLVLGACMSQMFTGKILNFLLVYGI